jgi:hypothetical protein
MTEERLEQMRDTVRCSSTVDPLMLTEALDAYVAMRDRLRLVHATAVASEDATDFILGIIEDKGLAAL